MDSSLMNALIGAGATLIAGFLASPFLKKFIIRAEKGKFYSYLPERSRSLPGSWIGYTTQKAGVNGKDMQVELNIVFDEHNGKLLTGTSQVGWKENDNSQSIRVSFTGGFISENYIRILYQYENSTIQNFGVAFLRLDAGGKKLEGRIIGYGHRFNDIVEGYTILNKQ